jgi:transglutaminase-like putative cysteine protease
MIEAQARVRPSPPRPIDLVVLALVALLLSPAIVALEAVPFAGNVPSWVVPAAVVGGLALGVVLVGAPLPRRWWWAVLSALLLFAGAATAGLVLIGHARRSADAQSLTFLLGMYAATLGAAAVWLVFRVQQPWLALVLVWTTIAGAWGTSLTLQRVWWVVFLLVLSLLLLGAWHLREETAVWRALALEQIGPVIWPSARAIVSMSLAVAVLGLLPLGAARLALLSQVVRGSPLASGGPLAYNRANGTPIAILGGPLSLDAPDVTSQRIVFTYDVLSSNLNLPTTGAAPADSSPLNAPFLAATLDTFTGSGWTQGPKTAAMPAPSALELPPGAATVRTRITIQNPPAMAGPTLLLGLDQPVSFILPGGVPARASAVSAGALTPLTVADWETTQPLTRGMTYTVTSAVLPDDVTPTGALPPALLARMTAVPPALTTQLSATARRWIGAAATPAAQAQALIDAMSANLVLDPRATPPAGADEVAWFLQGHHGNVLLWTTTYILLGRAVGLPLRMAEGYLPGSYDPALGHQVVRGSDATIWAQLAVPGEGWLDLLPTAKVLTVQVPQHIVYTGKPTPTPTPQPTAAPRTPGRHAVADQGAPPWTALGALLALFLVLVAAGAALIGWRWRRFGAGLNPLARFFARVALLCRLAGIALRSSDTSSQATDKVVVFVPEQAAPLRTLNRAYERMRYGPPGAGGPLPAIAETWRRLSGALWRLVMTRPWGRTRPPAGRKG